MLVSRSKGGFPGDSVIKNPPANTGDVGAAGREDPLEGEMATHSSFLAWENPRGRGAWCAIIHGVKKQSDMTQ